MSQETLSKPTEQHGMTWAQRREAIDLRTKSFLAENELEFPDPRLTEAQREAGHIALKNKVDEEVGAAETHYRANKAAYQEHALEEANRDGVDIEGWDKEK
jgi:hypothetical protein